MRAPHTWFSTEFNSGKGFLKLRLRSLLAGPKRMGVLPILLTLLCVATFGTMVACDQAGTPETPAATAEVIPTAVSDYAQDLAGEKGVWQFLSPAGSYDHVLKEGTLELYRAQLGTRDFDPDTTTLAGGMSIDENGYLFDGWTTLFLFQRIGEDYVPLTTASYVDSTAVQAAVDALLAESKAPLPVPPGGGRRRLCPPHRRRHHRRRSMGGRQWGDPAPARRLPAVGRAAPDGRSGPQRPPLPVWP